MNKSGNVETRADTWLWRTRFFKTRKAASDYISRKGLRLTRHGQTRKINKPGAHLLPGDILTFYRTKTIQTVEFLSPGTRRGPAAEAQTLYRAAPSGE